MISRKSLCLVLLGLLSVASAAQPVAQSRIVHDRYHSPDEVSAALQNFATHYPGFATLSLIGKSPGGAPLHVLEIADRGAGLAKAEARPAILVTANIEGNHLIGSEAALLLAERLLTGAVSDPTIKKLLENKVVYIAPLLNPDAAQSGYFGALRMERSTNATGLDEDLDTAIDEDGPDDLNQDGMITMMRVKDPEGEWIVDPEEPRLMRKADPQKGESGLYKLYLEGIDNDGDESYNEDPSGGVELNRNFPHDFENNTAGAGMWPVSQPETRALVDFMVAHRNIALVLNFSTENTILNFQQTARAKATGERVKVPQRFATMLGVDPEQEFELGEVVEMFRGSGVFGGEVSEDRVAQLLGSGPAVSLDRQDLPVFEAIQKEYKEALKTAGVQYPEKKARPVGKGSFVAYCYYQYGVPVFSTDIWAVPEAKKAETKKAAAGGEAPPDKEATPRTRAGNSSAGGTETPDLDLIRWSEAVLGGKGYVPWASYAHPTLGPVEIGGFAPFARVLPPPELIEKHIALPVDFYLKLMQKTAGLAIEETRVKSLSEGLYAVTCFLSNPGWLPTSSAQGRRAGGAWPVTVRIQTDKDQALFAGRPIESVPSIGGGETKKLEWTIRAKSGSNIQIFAESPKLGAVKTQVTLH